MKRLPFFDNPVLRVNYPLWRGRMVLILLACLRNFSRFGRII